MDEQVTRKVKVVHGIEIPYRLVNGYWLPDLKYPEPKREFHLNMWGRAHLDYLEKHSEFKLTNLSTMGELPDYLMDLQDQAQNMMDGIVEHLMEDEGVTEELKRQDQMEWVRRMESIRARARECVMEEIICR